MGYGYDLAGQLTSLAYPGNQIVTRGYDDAGRLTFVTDWASRTTTFGYDANANLTTQTYPNAVVATSGYDNADRLSSITHARSGTTVAGFAYTRTNSDLLASTTSTGVGTNETYGYNALDQLTAVDAGTYAYDAGDNLTAQPSGTTQAYDAANQLTSRTQASQTTTYGYDARGNRTSVTPPLPGLPTSLGYDQANRLTSYGVTTTYAYNGDGLRMSKGVTGVPTQAFVWDVSGQLPLAIKDGDKSYIYGPGGMPLEEISASGAATYYHADQLGSTRALTDQSGGVVGSFTYDAYGKLASSTGPATTPLGYTGQYTDAESGFQYLRARYYDPVTGQLMSRDPLASVTRETYGYVGGNPLNRTDPTGLFWSLEDVKAVGGEIVTNPIHSFREAYRAPDYFTFHLTFDTGITAGPVHLGVDFGLMIAKDGTVYYGAGGAASSPRLSASGRGGWLNQADTPSDCRVNQFVSGNGTSAALQAGGLSVAETYGWGGAANELGVGFGPGGGLSHTYMKPSRIKLGGW